MKFIRVRLTWFEAQEFCYQNEGYLAEITSNEEDSLLDKFLLEDLQYWIGLSDIANEGTWVWQDSHMIAEYTNWAPHQPNYFAGENCALKALWLYEGKPGWHNFGCAHSIGGSTAIHALCEYDIVRNH